MSQHSINSQPSATTRSPQTHQAATGATPLSPQASAASAEDAHQRQGTPDQNGFGAQTKQVAMAQVVSQNQSSPSAEPIQHSTSENTISQHQNLEQLVGAQVPSTTAMALQGELPERDPPIAQDEAQSEPGKGASVQLGVSNVDRSHDSRTVEGHTSNSQQEGSGSNHQEETECDEGEESDSEGDALVSVDDEEEEEEDSDEDEDEDGEEDNAQKIADESPRGRFKRFYEELGRGAYKIVYKGIDHDTGTEVAWNSISLTKLPPTDRARIKKEIDLIKSLQHDNIIHFIAGWQVKEKQEVVFITEITSGTLRRYIKKNKITKLRVIKGWCQSILNGLVYLHEQKQPIIHRDLKCDNIFINSNSGEIRIGDLGLSTPMNNSYTSSVLGTPEFMAPELYEEHYDCKVDIYAFGMCMLEMITQSRPYEECKSAAQIYKKVTKGEPPMALSRILDQEVAEFIGMCLHPDKTKRPTARELLESGFIQTLDDEKSKHAVSLGPSLRRNSIMHNRRKSFLLQQSVIPEEEEEVSDREDPPAKQSAAVAQTTSDRHSNWAKNSSKPSDDQLAVISSGQDTNAKKVNREQMVHQSEENLQHCDSWSTNETAKAGQIESMIREMNAQERHNENLEQDKSLASMTHTPSLKSTTSTQQSVAINQPRSSLLSSQYSMENAQRRESVLSTNTVRNSFLTPPIPALTQMSSVQSNTTQPDREQPQKLQTETELMRCSTEQTAELQAEIDQLQRSSADKSDEIQTQAASPALNARQARAKQSQQSLSPSPIDRIALDLAGVQSQSKDSQQSEKLRAFTQGDNSDRSPLLRLGMDKLQAPPEGLQSMSNTHQVSSTQEAAGFGLGADRPPPGGSGFMLAVQQYSDGNQSQSSGMTIRKLTDVGNPDCTFSDPKFVQENEEQSLVSIREHQAHPSIRPGESPFASLGAQDQAEMGCPRSRIESQEACFGGSGTDEDVEEGKQAYESHYSADSGVSEADSADEVSDDDEESRAQMMNESMRYLNELDRLKHEQMKHRDEPDSTQPLSLKDQTSAQGQSQLDEHSHPVKSSGNQKSGFEVNMFDDFKQRLQKEDELARNNNLKQTKMLAAASQPISKADKVRSVTPTLQTNGASMSQHVQKKHLRVSPKYSSKQQQMFAGSSETKPGNSQSIAKKHSSMTLHELQSQQHQQHMQYQQQQQAAQQQAQNSPRASQQQQQQQLIPIVSQQLDKGMPPSSTSSVTTTATASTTPQAVSVLKQPAQSDQKKSTLVVVRKFGEDDMAKGGAQLLIDQGATKQSQKTNHAAQTVQSMTSPHQSLMHASSTESPAHVYLQQQQMVQSRHGSHKSSSIKGSQSALSLLERKHNQGNTSASQASKSTFVNKNGFNNEGSDLTPPTHEDENSSEFDEQRSSSESEDFELSDQATAQVTQAPLIQEIFGRSNTLKGLKRRSTQELSPEFTNAKLLNTKQGSRLNKMESASGVSRQNKTRNVSPNAYTQQLRTGYQGPHGSLTAHKQPQATSQREPAHAQQQHSFKNTRKVSITKSSAKHHATKQAAQHGAASGRQQSLAVTPGGAGESWTLVTASPYGRPHNQTGVSSTNQVPPQQVSVEAQAQSQELQPTTPGISRNQKQQNKSRLESDNDQGQPTKASLPRSNSINKHVKEKSHQVTSANGANQPGNKNGDKRRISDKATRANGSGLHKSDSSSRLVAPSSSSKPVQLVPSSQPCNQLQQLQSAQSTQIPHVPGMGSGENLASPAVHSTWFRQSSSVINITIQYPVPTDSKRKGIASFNFDTHQDTPQGVVSEMVSELSVNPGFTRPIQREIEASVRQFSIQETNKQKVEAEKAEKDKEKHLKHQFRKLQSHIEVFFAEMKAQGLSSNKEICRVFEQLYPAAVQPEDKTRSCYIEGLAKINKIVGESSNSKRKQVQRTTSSEDHIPYHQPAPSQQTAAAQSSTTTQGQPSVAMATSLSNSHENQTAPTHSHQQNLK